MRTAFLICLFLAAFSAQAEATLPAGCQAIAVQGESVTLQSPKSKLIFIHNLSNTDLWITHPVTDAGASAGWTSRLQADNWSALVMEETKPFELQCIESRPGHEQQVPCAGVIAVCEWKKVKMPAKAPGTFWAGEDMSLSGLIAAIGGRGFIVPTSPAT